MDVNNQFYYDQFAGFVDEDIYYKSFTGSEDFYNFSLKNIFSPITLIGEGKRQKAKEAAFANAQRDLYKDLKDDCDNIQSSIDIISNDVETLLKKKSDLETKVRLSEANNVLGEFKRKQIANKCEEIKAAALKESERAKSLELLTSISDSTVNKAKGDLAGLIGGDAKNGSAATVGGINKNVLLYGGIGLGVLLVAAIIIKR